MIDKYPEHCALLRMTTLLRRCRASAGADPEKMNCEGISPLARATQRKDGKMLSMMRASECAPSDGNEAQ